MRRFVAFVLLVFPVCLLGQANGKLQLHFIDVGKGDGALLISPGGETVLFDNGEFRNSEEPPNWHDTTQRMDAPPRMPPSRMTASKEDALARNGKFRVVPQIGTRP